jgi:hypothetical protein
MAFAPPTAAAAIAALSIFLLDGLSGSTKQTPVWISPRTRGPRVIVHMTRFVGTHTSKSKGRAKREMQRRSDASADLRARDGESCTGLFQC